MTTCANVTAVSNATSSDDRDSLKAGDPIGPSGLRSLATRHSFRRPDDLADEIGTESFGKFLVGLLPDRR